MSKYVYTCPDVIHDRKVAKIKTIAILGATVAIGAISWIADWRESKRNSLPDLEFTSTDLEA